MSQNKKTHDHIYCEFTSKSAYKWIQKIKPEPHWEAVTRKKADRVKAWEYVRKDGEILWETGKPNIWIQEHINEKQDPAYDHWVTKILPKPAKMSRDEKAREIVRLVETGNIEEVKREFPQEYLYTNATIEKMATRCLITQLQQEEIQPIHPKRKNVYLLGDPGTGKPFLARKRCGICPFNKTQNKWFDGLSSQTPGIIWNDLQPMQGFNWQTLLDSADQYPIQVEIKGGTTIWDPRQKPVWVTSNYSPEEIMEHQPQARIEALKRRFTIVKGEWITFGQLKTLHWTIENGQTFKVPK
jgi:hypothetical protein